MESPDMTLQTPLPASSDAEIRAFLRPLLKAGKPPTYKAMRATLGGGFSRLARIKKQVERELAGGDAENDHEGRQVVASGLVTTLEGLFERQWKAIEEWERRSVARLGPMPVVERSPSVSKIKGFPEASSAQADRLEALERRLLAMLEKLQGMIKAPVPQPAPVPADASTLGDVPPAWARQAAAAATSALDGRLQSMEEAMGGFAAGARGAFDLAAEIVREVAADASRQLQVARSTLLKAVRDELASPDRSEKLDMIVKTVQDLRSQVGSGFAIAAATADRRAVAIRDVVIAMTEIEMAQVEMFESAVNGRSKGKRERHTYPRRPS